MGNPTTTILKKSRYEKTSIIAEILMRETPMLEKVFWVLDSLQNEKAGLYRDLLKYPEGSEESELLNSQLKEVKFDRDTAEEYIEELIKHKGN